MKSLYLIVPFLFALFSACELSDNIDPKAPIKVPAEALFSNALRDGLAHTDNMDQNFSVSRMLCQYISMMQYVDPSRYQFKTRQIPDGYWNTAYLVLRDLKEVRKLLTEEVPIGGVSYLQNRANKMAIADIMEVVMMQNLVDIFGNVPYKEALEGFDNKTPAYDDARSIYEDLQTRLSNDITTLTRGINSGSWDNEDLVYSGDVVMWRKFASTLKLRMGMRLADVDPALAQSYLSEALAAGCLESGEAMQLRWPGIAPQVNTIYNVFIMANRNDYVPSKTIIDIMEGMSDARMPAYFSQVDTTTQPGVEMLAYIGLEYGLVGGSGYPAFSHFSDPMFAPDFPATLACHAELEFLLAEAAARGLDVGGGSASEHYEAGIIESHNFWGVTMDPDYLNHPGVAWDISRARELIGTQKWIALYNRGNEGYASWRCFDWPVLTAPQEMSYEDIPMRMPYPYNEPSLNGGNYQAAADAIGGDDVRTLIFWDVTAGTENPPPSFQ